MPRTDEDSQERDDPEVAGDGDDDTETRWRQLGVGVFFGVVIGGSVGLATDNLVLWLSIGLALGFAVGAVER